MIEPPKNIFKRRLLKGEVQIGIWMSIPNPLTAEAISLLGYDWLLFDSEHAPVEIGQMLPLLQAAAAGNSAIAARPAWNDKVLIKKILDIGAQTVLVPFVQTEAEAREAVAATRYPPEGVRGVAGSTRASRFGLAPGYQQKANDEICTLVQIETVNAMQQLESIAAVDGVDGIFIGPSDLSASMGYLGNSGADEVQATLKSLGARINETGKAPGILASQADDAKRYLDWGYRFVAIGADLGLLVNGARQRLEDVRAHNKN